MSDWKETLTTTTIAVGMILTATPVAAQWKGEAGLGVVAASGNTDTSSISGSVAVSTTSGKWKHNLFGDIYRTKADGVKAADRLMLGYKADRDFSARIYGWGSLRSEQDNFANIDQRFVGLVGIGHHTLLGPVHTVDLEAAAGYRATAFIDGSADSNEAVIALRSIYSGKFTNTVSLSQRLSLEVGDDNSLLESVTGLNVKLSTGFRCRWLISCAVTAISLVPGARSLMVWLRSILSTRFAGR